MPETHSHSQADSLAHAQAAPGFMQIQQAFTAHLRDPDQQPPPAGIEDRRLQIYRELIFNNLASLLEQGFPVLNQCLGRERWRALIRGFLIAHRAETPLFPELGQELLAYLSTAGALRPEDPPFVLELAHYEWVETALTFSDAKAGPALADPNGDLLDGVPVVSPAGLEPQLPLSGASHQCRSSSRTRRTRSRRIWSCTARDRSASSF